MREQGGQGQSNRQSATQSQISFGDSGSMFGDRAGDRPRIVGGKVVESRADRDAAAAAYNRQFAPQQQQQAQQAPPQQQYGGGGGYGQEPPMRGTEGYQPNYGAFANGGLQSSSTELKGPQQVGRSSTRLHAPPGGVSQISFG